MIDPDAWSFGVWCLCSVAFAVYYPVVLTDDGYTEEKLKLKIETIISGLTLYTGTLVVGFIIGVVYEKIRIAVSGRKIKSVTNIEMEAFFMAASSVHILLIIYAARDILVKLHPMMDTF